MTELTGGDDDHADLVPDGRDESLEERMDRNWNEMLQEMRVTQTGTQLLSGFLLTIVFQPTFGQLDRFDKTLYLCLVCLAALTTALALAPVNLHRSLFRKREKPALVTIGHILLRAALFGLAIVITGTVLLVFDVATGDRQTSLVVAAVAVVVLVLLASLPLLVRSPWFRRVVKRAVR